MKLSKLMTIFFYVVQIQTKPKSNSTPDLQSLEPEQNNKSSTLENFLIKEILYSPVQCTV